ncbi:MAG: homoserine kinase [Terriglobales bacterium]
MTRRPATPIEITLPASSANLGPAFDSAAMALRLFLKVRAEASDRFTVTAGGRDAELCGGVENNLLIETYTNVLQSLGKDAVPLKIALDNKIPVGKGLGSSAAARLAGIALARHFGRLEWTDDQVVAEAAEREHHADNVAACWFGGVVVVHLGKPNGSGRPHIETVQLNARNSWPILLCIPEDRLPTEDARAVLPEQYSRADLVSSLQSAMLLTAALVKGRPDLLRDALKDCVHEPYRKSLCPLLEPLQSLAGTSGIMGAVLSGAGPSVLMVLDPKVPAEEIVERIEKQLRRRGIRAELVLTRVASQGARGRIRRVISAASTRRSK